MRRQRVGKTLHGCSCEIFKFELHRSAKNLLWKQLENVNKNWAHRNLSGFLKRKGSQSVYAVTNVHARVLLHFLSCKLDSGFSAAETAMGLFRKCNETSRHESVFSSLNASRCLPLLQTKSCFSKLEITKVCADCLSHNHKEGVPVHAKQRPCFWARRFPVEL